MAVDLPVEGAGTAWPYPRVLVRITTHFVDGRNPLWRGAGRSGIRAPGGKRLVHVVADGEGWSSQRLAVRKARR